MTEYLKNLLQLIFSPAKGWEDLRSSAKKRFADEYDSSGKDVPPTLADECTWEEAASMQEYYRSFLPLTGLFAVSAFARMLYEDDPDFLGALQNTLIIFVSLFLSSQIARYLLNMYLPRFIDPKTPARNGRIMQITMYCLTFIGLIICLTNIIKVRIALMEFLPFYVIFIIWKGCKYVGVAEIHEGAFMITATTLILGSVYLISFLLNSLV